MAVCLFFKQAVFLGHVRIPVEPDGSAVGQYFIAPIPETSGNSTPDLAGGDFEL